MSEHAVREYYIEANSFAAPFCSDTSFKYIKAETPEAALLAFVEGYRHPAGLYAAMVYDSADARNKGQNPLATWLCNHEIEKTRLTKDLGSFSYCGHGPGRFEVNDVMHVVPDPKGGRIVNGAPR